MPAEKISAILLLILLTLGASIAVTTKAFDVVGEVSIGEAKVTVAAVAPTVSFAFYSDSTYSTTTNEFTPQSPTYMKITVSTDNIMSDVVIKVDLFADTNAGAVGTPPASTDPALYVNFTISYDSTSGQWVLTADTGGSTTWSIELDPNQQQPDPGATSGDFYVVITPGKVAAEASSSGAEYADWDCIVTASVDTESSTASGYGYIMYFYSEISTSTVGIDFGTLQPGSSGGIQQVNTGSGYTSANSFAVNIIANGPYNINLTTSDTWYHTDGVHYITLGTGTSPGTGEFLLFADDQENSTNPGLPLNKHPVTSTLASSEGVLETPASRTTEAGQSYNIYMEIDLGTGIAVGTYTGTVTVTATDAT